LQAFDLHGCGAAHRANCGVTVPAENPAALMAAIVSLKGNPELRRVLGANARAYAERHFTKATVLRAYDEFFLSTLCTTGLSPAPKELLDG
jgi:colanic acid biosynthesis glycosyl transferase WcaI